MFRAEYSTALLEAICIHFMVTLGSFGCARCSVKHAQLSTANLKLVLPHRHLVFPRFVLVYGEHHSLGPTNDIPVMHIP